MNVLAARIDVALAAHRRLVLVIIVAIALGAASVWALRVPLLGAPDENTHADYAFAIWSNGAPISAALHPLHIDVHPYTKFLERVGAIDTTRFDDGGILPAGYGSAAYFAAAERTAPALPAGWWTSAPATPYIAGSYPFGYYAIEAAVFGTAMLLSHSVIASFFAMRFFDVALLGVTLVASYAALRELHLRPALALVATAAIGWLPTMQALFASVQPDALAVTLFQVTLWLGLRVRRRGLDLWHALAIGATFALFAVVKVHIFAAAAIAVAPVLAWSLYRERTSPIRAVLLIAVAIAPALVTHEIASGLARHGPSELAYSNFPSPLAELRAHPVAYLGSAGTIAGHMLRSLYFGGPAETEYYDAFSCLHTPIFGDPALAIVDLAIVESTALVAAAMVLRTIRVTRALGRVARRRSLGTALRVASSDVVFTGYVTFAAVLIAAEIYVGEIIKPEGRYDLPIVLGAVAIAARYAPRALPAAWRRGAGAALATLLCCYGALGTIAGLGALDHRYYRGGDPAAESREYAIYLMHFAAEGFGNDARTVPRGTIVHGGGYAFDSHKTTPTDVIAKIDGNVVLPVRNGLAAPREVDEIGDERLASGGFAFDVDTARLAPGTHALTFFAREPGGVVPAARAPFVFHVLARSARS